MCGRFSFKHEWPDFVDLHDLLWDVERCRNTRAGRNTAPTRQVLKEYNEANGKQVADEARCRAGVSRSFYEPSMRRPFLRQRPLEASGTTIHRPVDVIRRSLL